MKHISNHLRAPLIARWHIDKVGVKQGSAVVPYICSIYYVVKLEKRLIVGLDGVRVQTQLPAKTCALLIESRFMCLL